MVFRPGWICFIPGVADGLREEVYPPAIGSRENQGVPQGAGRDVYGVFVKVD